MRGLGLTGVDDDFLLRRLRLYANWKATDDVRVYAEYLNANSDFEDFFLPRLIEDNPHEIQNLFVDLRLAADDEGELWGRAGRQELLYGSQRLISPLDWANTRRTFDAKLYYSEEDWDLDGFWVRPIFGEPQSLDSPDGTQEFYALWWTYRGVPLHVYELFWIGYADYDAPFAAADSFKFQTAGGHWKGERDGWLGEVEARISLASSAHLITPPGFFTVGGGRSLSELPGKPVVWLYYDWASGDDTIGNGFNQLFPLGHKYLGYMDFFGAHEHRRLEPARGNDSCGRLEVPAVVAHLPPAEFERRAVSHQRHAVCYHAGRQSVLGAGTRPAGHLEPDGTHELAVRLFPLLHRSVV